MNTATVEFLNHYATPVPESGCWLWLGAVSERGYGKGGKRCHSEQRGHRMAYVLEYGPIPAGKNVCHRCDVRSCINPAHLFLGTQAENIADMLLKGRQAIGSRKNRARGEQLSNLKDAQVLQIRADTRPARVIAAEYGIGVQCVYKIRTNQRWRHI